jgi:uncharacterized membrane protein YhaH (DUF805 family)
MSFTEAVRAGFRNWSVINARASRSEYWWWALFLFLGSTGIALLVGVFAAGTRSSGYGGAAVISLLFLLAAVIVVVPTLTVGIRRLHDTGRSAWWLLLGLVPYVGAFILLVFYCLDGTQGPNAWGDRPGGTVPGSRHPGVPLIGVAEELKKLDELRTAGTISDQEFARQRARLLPE